MRSGGADYRDEKALKPIVAAQPLPPELPDNLNDFI